MKHQQPVLCRAEQELQEQAEERRGEPERHCCEPGWLWSYALLFLDGCTVQYEGRVRGRGGQGGRGRLEVTVSTSSHNLVVSVKEEQQQQEEGEKEKVEGEDAFARFKIYHRAHVPM